MPPASTRADRAPDWRGRTVVCIASGPSATQEDCDLVQGAGHPVIVTNTTFRLAPWADVVFGMDSRWWLAHADEVLQACPGRLMTAAPSLRIPRVETTHGVRWFQGFGNSGTCAISLAVAGGAAKIILLGFDCQKTGGKAHWHGDHPPTLSNARSLKTWPGLFLRVAAHAKKRGSRVVNCSRETALTCFERGALENEL